MDSGHARVREEGVARSACSYLCKTDWLPLFPFYCNLMVSVPVPFSRELLCRLTTPLFPQNSGDAGV